MLIALLVSVTGTGMVRIPANQEPPPPVPNVEDDEAIRAFLKSSPYVNLPEPEQHYPNVEPSALGAPDNYGYRWDDQQYSYDWKDASTGGAVVAFDGYDEAHAGPLSLGFDFKFYENTYSKVFVSTNGYLSFGEGSEYLENKALPNDGPPNNIIAPFWDDLVVGGVSNNGKVFTKKVSNHPNDYFVIEWKDITRSGDNTDKLTFEAILYENGDICFQYHTLSGTLDSATVGIEDADGVVGSTYLSNSAQIKDLEGVKALCFIRPAQGPHVKALPAYQSGFSDNGAASFQTQVHNIGEVGADVYNLIVELNNTNWGYSLLNGNTLQPLSDSNSDGKVDTGSVGMGSSKPVVLKLTEPANAPAGSTVGVTLKVVSTLDNKIQSLVKLRGAVAANFTQVYSDSQSDIHLELISAGDQKDMAIGEYFTGSTMSLASSDQSSVGVYVYAWERNASNGSIFYSNIEYMILNGFGRTIRQPKKLTDNGSASQQTTDHFPAVTIAPNGMVGFVWIRDIVNSNFNVNSNVYFAILSQSGEFVHGPVNLTGNTGWRGNNDANIPTFAMPRITATQDNRFVIGWVDDRLISGSDTSDLAYAIYGSSGQSYQAPKVLLDSNPGGKRYLYPAVTALSDNRVLFAYTVYDPGPSTHTIGYAVVTSSGSTAKGGTALGGSAGWRPDVVQASTGSITIAWTDTDNQKITFAVLNGANYSVIQSPTLINNPDQREANYVSVTKDRDGHVVLTWMDDEWNNYLYYALINHDGTIKTPAMIYRTGDELDPLIRTSENGQGNAVKVQGQIFVPLAIR